MKECEIKIKVETLESIRKILKSRFLKKEYEINRIYDTDEGLGFLFRIREIEGKFILTIKGKSEISENGTKSRSEFETPVNDPEALIKSLNLKLVASYENDRETYQFGDVLILLDDLEFGTYVEIEGPTVEAVEKAWPTAPLFGYTFRASLVAYLWIGVVLLLTAWDPVRYRVQIDVAIVGLFLMAVVCFIAGVANGIPALWYLGDSLLSLLAAGLLFVFRPRKTKA